MKKIDKLIINSPYKEPTKHWFYNRDNRDFELREGRRKASYIVATPNSQAFDDPGIQIEIELVSRIRPRVKEWREKNYPGVTGTTKRLLLHWRDEEERKDRMFFFCQLEAIETLIWLKESPDADRTGIEIPSDGGDFSRWCSKMATGSGKTIVMAQLIAWQVLNKVADSKDTRFSKNILIVAPGLTVKNRLCVLNPSNTQNYYEEFNIVPQGMMETLRQAKIKIINWHKLAWDSQKKLDEKIAKGNLRTVDKRKKIEISDEGYIKDVLGDMASATNILIINDEAHHAWRVPPESKVKGIKKEELEESTVWVGGLDRINRSRGILQCFDFSATPFAPTGKKASEEALFPWIVSDFGLNDAIESGLVKTPRVVIHDDGSPAAKDLRSRLYHLYMDSTVKDDIADSRKAQPTEPLPDLIKNAYILLGKDWKAVYDRWKEKAPFVPPVMITVTNTTYTSARIKYSFDHDSFLLNAVGLGELENPEKTLQIDSSIINKVESGEFGEFNGDDSEQEIENVDIDADEKEDDEPVEKKKTKKELAFELREKVDTIGRIGEPGEQIQNVISVGMLSEGWDAKTVTHIMGLRAFSSQLLCEQVVGRGLRRTEYTVNPETGLFEPEYVNIFGIPFTFLPHEDTGETRANPPKPTTEIKADKEKQQHIITFPNVLRIDHIYKPQLTLNMGKVKPLELDPYESITEAQLGAIIAGKPTNLSISQIDLVEIGINTRMQTIIFKVASAIYNSEKKPEWKGSKENFLVQLIGLIEKFIDSDKIRFKNSLFNQNEVRKRILIMLNMNKVIQHIWNEIRAVNTTQLTPVFDKEHPIRTTTDLRTWWTSKPCEKFDKTHINFVVVDSKLEYLEAKKINDSSEVDSFVKNDHLGFAIIYNHQGIISRYFPDFIIKLKTGENLILETKGKDSEKDKTKRAFLNEWCKAINQNGGFGKWSWAVSYSANDLDMILQNSALSFAGHIFVDTDDFTKAENIFASANEFFETYGFEISDEGKIKQGSWFKEKVVYKIRNIYRSKEAQELFDKTKKALELQQIELHQSTVTKNYAEAAAALLNSFKEVPNIAIFLNPLIIAKATVNGEPQLVIYQMTIDEIIFLDKNPELKNNPLELIRQLNCERNKMKLN